MVDKSGVSTRKRGANARLEDKWDEMGVDDPIFAATGGDAVEPFRLPDGQRMTVGERFQFALRLLPVEIRGELGRNEKTLRTWKTAGDMSLDVIFALAAKTGIPVCWIVEGTVGPIGASGEMATAFSFVPQLHVQAGAGNGVVSPEMTVDADIVAFRSEWLRKLGINPRYARAMFARGDSMWPTINDGDLLLVDESITQVVDDGIYIIVSQGAVRVKRLQIKRDGSLLVKSDNSAYEPELVPANEIDDIRVAARVRWYGRSI